MESLQGQNYNLDIGSSFTNEGATRRGSDSGSGSGSSDRLRSSVRRAISAAQYQKGEKETIRQVLEEIESMSVKRMKEGFNHFNFSVGVFNCVSYTHNTRMMNMCA